MRNLNELIDIRDPGIEKIREWMREAINDCVLLPPSEHRGEVLLQTQVTTRSTMGAIAYETGGVLVDGGWLRFPGSGHPNISRTLPDWNKSRSNGYYLVADDAAGGFFAINGGALGTDVKNMYYWAPDSLEWRPMNIGFTDFLCGRFQNGSRNSTNPCVGLRGAKIPPRCQETNVSPSIHFFGQGDR